MINTIRRFSFKIELVLQLETLVLRRFEKSKWVDCIHIMEMNIRVPNVQVLHGAVFIV